MLEICRLGNTFAVAITERSLESKLLFWESIPRWLHFAYFPFVFYYI
jgi:hypothetical protein